MSAHKTRSSTCESGTAGSKSTTRGRSSVSNGTGGVRNSIRGIFTSGGTSQSEGYSCYPTEGKKKNRCRDDITGTLLEPSYVKKQKKKLKKEIAKLRKALKKVSDLSHIEKIKQEIRDKTREMNRPLTEWLCLSCGETHYIGQCKCGIRGRDNRRVRSDDWCCMRCLRIKQCREHMEKKGMEDHPFVCGSCDVHDHISSFPKELRCHAHDSVVAKKTVYCMACRGLKFVCKHPECRHRVRRKDSFCTNCFSRHDKHVLKHLRRIQRLREEKEEEKRIQKEAKEIREKDLQYMEFLQWCDRQDRAAVKIQRFVRTRIGKLADEDVDDWLNPKDEY